MRAQEAIRPNPDELLRRVEFQDADERRGRLKIFLGYAARVGKSSRMFDEGARRKTRGQDVVVGNVQLKGSQQLSDKLVDFEIISPMLESRVENGDAGESLDVDAVLRRKPEVCLVDELAHDNRPGAACSQRWQDVEQLLEAGVNVVTCINLQHVEEQQDTVERITGRRAACSVPEAFIRSADEIVIVDVPPEDVVSAKDRASGSAHSYDARQLSQLRELALLLAAEVVEDQLQRYMNAHGIQQSWGTQERILVCVTSRSNARAMIESGRRNADRFHGQLLAAYVKQSNLTRAGEESLEANLEYARRLGADVHVIEGPDDPVSQLIEFARSERITQMFVGHTQRPAWAFWSANPLKKLIEAAEGMDVRIFPHPRIA